MCVFTPNACGRAPTWLDCHRGAVVAQRYVRPPWRTSREYADLCPNPAPGDVRPPSPCLLGELPSHQLDELLEAPEGTDHHGELDQPVLVVPSQHVDPLHERSGQLGLEFQHCAAIAVPLLDIAQRGPE